MNIRLIILTLLVLAIGLILPIQKVLAQDSNASPYKIFYDALESELLVINEYAEFVDSTDTPSLESFKAKINSWSNRLTTAGNKYKNYATNTDSTVEHLASLAIVSNKYGVSAMNNYRYALNTESELDSGRYFELGDKDMTTYITKRDEVIDYYNEVSGANETEATGNVYQWGTIISGLISFFIWLKSRTKSTISAEIVKAQVYRNLFVSSVWMFLGFLITYIGFSFTSEGGTYYILYGLVLFGGWEFLKGLYKYFTAGRTTLMNLAKAERYDIYKKGFEGMDNDQ